MSSYQFEVIDWSRMMKWIILFFACALTIFCFAYWIWYESKQPCWHEYSYDCKNYQVEQCMASEKYSRGECINLIGSK